MNVLILAGGFATRLWPLTEKRAKPLLLLDGKTILAHILDKVPREAHVFLLTNGKFKADFETELAALDRETVQIFCEDAHTDGEKMGALRAVSVAIQHFGIADDVIILAGDNLLPELEIPRLQGERDQAKIAVRAVDTLDEARKFGVVEVDQAGQVTAFAEKPEHPTSTLVSTGFMSLGADLFPILHDFSQAHPDALGRIFTELLAHQKTVLAEPCGGDWFDVGSFETYLQAHQKLQTQALKQADGVQQYGNRFSGKVFLGAGSTVVNCQMLDCIVYPNVRLENCFLSHTVIDEDCELAGLDLNKKLVRRGTKLRA